MHAGPVAEVKTVAILGAGHGGCAAAADLSLRGYAVRLHSRSEDRLRPLREARGITLCGARQGTVMPALLTTDLAAAVEGADLVMLVVPSVAHAAYARGLARLLQSSQVVLLNPGHTGGGLHLAWELRRAGLSRPVLLCETVTLSYICRLEAPATVGLYSYTRRLGFAALPARETERLCSLLKPVYPEILAASSVLETALSNMNAVFHPPGMLMNIGWIESTGGDFLFYAQAITEAVGRVVSAVDAERLAVARTLGVPAKTFLETFFEAGLTTPGALASGSVARACRESAPNRTIKSPPSLNHRYLHEDVGYGLVPMAELAALAGVPTPTMDSLIHLASTAQGLDYRRDGLTLERLGLQGLTVEALLRVVREGA